MLENFPGIYCIHDVALLCPTLHAIRQMLSVAKSYSEEFNIGFNASKTQFVLFGNAVHGCVGINFDGNVINCTFSTTHLGQAFGPHAIDNGIGRALNDMYRRTNTLVAIFSTASPFVRYRVFKYIYISKYYRPVLYGAPLWDLSSSAVAKEVNVGWRKCVCKVMHLPYRTHCSLLSMISNDCTSRHRYVEGLSVLYLILIHACESVPV